MLICCFIYNFIHTKIPYYLNDIFIRNNNQTRSGLDTISLMVKKVKLTRDEHLLAHCASKLWNEIPSNIKNCDNKEIFNRNIKKYYFEKQLELN